MQSQLGSERVSLGEGDSRIHQLELFYLSDDCLVHASQQFCEDLPFRNKWLVVGWIKDAHTRKCLSVEGTHAYVRTGMHTEKSKDTYKKK